MLKFVCFFLGVFLTLTSFSQFVINGNVTDMGNGEYRLTEALNNQVGTIWSEQKISLNAPFEIELELYFGTNDNGADGITFSLQPKSNTVGVAGGGLGIGGISPSLITEMDTYRNGSYGDPSYDHIALVKNTVDHRGADNLVTPTQIVAGQNNVEDGGWYNFKATWDPVNQVYQTYVNGIQRFSYEGDIINDIFNGDPDVFWGFTASTGGARNDQRVRIINTTIIDLFDCTETPNDKTFCDNGGPASVTFDFSDVQANATYEWFDTKDRDNLLGTGLTYTDNAVTDDIDYYVVATFPDVVNTGGTVGPTTAGANGIQETQFFDGNNRNFTVQANLDIKSVDVVLPVYNGGCFAVGTTLSNTIDILNSSGAIVSSTNIVGNCGEVTTVPLNVSLTPGSYTMKFRTYTFNSFQVTGDGTEKSIPGVITLEDNTITNTWGTRNFSSTFFNWVIETAGSTGTAECLFAVKAERDCPPCTTFPAVTIGNDFTYCSENDTTIEVTTSAANVLWSTNENTNQITVGEGTFTVEVWDDPNCPSFANIVVNRECPSEPAELLTDTIEVCSGVTDTIVATNVEQTNWASTSPFVLINDSTISVNLTSDAQFQVENYIRLNIVSDNIDFEDPRITSNFQQMDAGLIPGWETTAPDNKMEIWRSGFLGVPSYRGEQFIEINATSDAALYQEMTTVPGEVIGINLAHRGRGGVDVMRLLAGPSGGPYTEINQYSDGTSAWGYYNEYYTVPAGQTTTRFMFETISCNGGPCTGSGNFLDAIEFFRVETQADSVYVKVNQSPSVDLGLDQTVCDGVTVTLDAGNPTFNHLWSTTETTQSIDVTTSGQYDVHVFDNSTNCEAFDTVNVTFESSPIVDLGNDTTICDGVIVTLDAGNPTLTHAWSTSASTQTIDASSSGEYIVTVSNGTGCQTKDTLDVTVLPQPNVNLGNDTLICEGESLVFDALNSGFIYSWSTLENSQAITVSSAGIYGVRVYNTGCEDFDTVVVTTQALPIVDLGPDTSFCDGVTINLDAQNASSNYSWSTTETTQTIDVSTSGLYAVQVTDALGCIGNGERRVTVLPQPSVDLGNDTLICEGTLLNLNANNSGFNYSWSSSESSQTIQVNTSGTYGVRVHDSGCEDFDTIVVTVQPNPVVDLGNDVSICQGDQVILDAMNPLLTHTWSTGENTQTITVTSSNQYSVTVEDTEGCVGTSNITVTVNDLPVVSLSSAKSDACYQGGNVLLSSSPNGGTLTGAGLTGSYFNPQTTGLTIDQANWIVYEYTDANGCASADSLTITVREEPVIPTLSDNTICIGDVASYSLTVNGAVTYDWYNSSQSIVETISDVEFGDADIYQVEVSNTYCSSLSNEFEVTVLDPEVFAFINPDDKVLLGESTSLEVEDPRDGYVYTWSLLGADIGTGTSLEVFPTEDSEYMVTANIQGCEASSEVEVEVALPVIVPSMFTPNGDGSNDEWILSGIESYDDNYVVTVFNRWGNIVFKSVGGYEPWDGTQDGEDLPFAVYYYVIELEGGKYPPLTGDVTIMR